MDRSHLHCFIRVLSFHRQLGEVPRAMNMIRAKLQEHTFTIRRPRLDSIRGQLVAYLVARHQAKRA